MPIDLPTNITLEELLDSDDELPLDYNDISTTPAYELDSRFDMIQFKWINDFQLPVCKSPGSSKTSSIIVDESELSYFIRNDVPIINRGVLKKHDLFCLKSIQGFTGDSTLIWLVNFLIYKDLQSDYEFLKSCLVTNIMFNESDNIQSKSSRTDTRDNNQCYNFSIKV